MGASRSSSPALSVSPSLRRIDLTVETAGQVTHESFPATPNQEHLYEWNGKDAYGRDLNGTAVANITIAYAYGAVYRTPQQLSASFAQYGAGTAGTGGSSGIAADRARQEVILSQRFRVTIAKPVRSAAELGNWALDAHHSYDPVRQTASLGSGDVIQTGALGAITHLLRPTGNDGIFPRHVAATADGSVYYSDGSSGNPGIATSGARCATARRLPWPTCPTAATSY